jgi:serine acetyltransferase
MVCRSWGAIVIDDVPPHVTVVGVPARILRKHAVGREEESALGERTQSGTNP